MTVNEHISTVNDHILIENVQISMKRSICMDIQQKEINHIRFYFPMIERLNMALNNEQMGRLFFAVADYAMTGKKEMVDGDIIFPYGEICHHIDKRRMGL